MPYVVTANCIVCKDLGGSDGPTADVEATPPPQHADGVTPRLPEHLRQPASDPGQTEQKPDADDAASG